MNRSSVEYCGAANRVAVYSGKGAISISSTSAASTITQPATTAPPASTGAAVPKYGQVSGVLLVGRTYLTT